MLRQKKRDFSSDLNKKFNVAHINLCTEAEGPHKRMAIWFQGCNILCEGCCNPELQPLRKVHIMTAEDILELAVNSRKENGIEGVTLLGGEPTLQEHLEVLCGILQEHDFGVILFTGKLLSELSFALKGCVDLVVDGQFLAHQLDIERNLIGSTNQQIHFITRRYEEDNKWFCKLRENKIEINISDKRDYLITGDVI